MPYDRGISSYQLPTGGKRYRVRLMVENKAYKWEGFSTIGEARNWRDDRKQDARHGRPFPKEASKPSTRSIASVIDSYLIEAKHKKNYNGEVTYAEFWKAQHGSIDSTALQPDHIAKARRVLLTKGVSRGPVSPATVNRYTAWYHHVLNREVDNGTILRNPCKQFIRSSKKGGQRFTERKAPEQVWTDQDLERLSKELGPSMIHPLLAMLTGLRQAEQFTLKKSQLNLKKGVGYLGDTKANEGQAFAINTDARTILEHCCSQYPDSPWVFPNPNDWTRPRSGKAWYKNQFKPACARAGIILSRKDGKTWHTLRHSFADRLVEQNVHIQEVQQAGRWNSFQAMQRYLKKRRDRVSAGVELLKSPLELARILYGTIKTTRKRTGTATI